MFIKISKCDEGGEGQQITIDLISLSTIVTEIISMFCIVMLPGVDSKQRPELKNVEQNATQKKAAVKKAAVKKTAVKKAAVKKTVKKVSMRGQPLIIPALNR